MIIGRCMTLPRTRALIRQQPLVPLQLVAGARAPLTTRVCQVPVTQLAGASVLSTSQRVLAVKHATQIMILVVEMATAGVGRVMRVRGAARDASTSKEYSVDASFGCPVLDL